MKTGSRDLETLSDNALMLKVKEGDLDRLGLLFERYKRPLFGFFYGMNKDSELSEDLVQNVFFRILKYRYLFRGEGDFRTWLFHIARNVNNDHYRKNRLGKTEAVDKYQDHLGAEDPQAIRLQQSEEAQLLAAAMDRLTPDKKEILLLSKFHEKKYREIGEILGCSEGAVKVKVFRALQELKVVYKQLEKYV